MHMSKFNRAVFALLVAAFASGTTAACVKQEIRAAPQQQGVGPSLVVEQYMRAANARDLDTMAKLFGTKEGPVSKRWPKAETEPRMFAIARELAHQDFEILREEMVPGRDNQATRLMVKVTKDTKTYNVPFTLVRYGDTGWLIEEIGIQAITGSR